MQTDLFAVDSVAVRSFPPHLDPARRLTWECTTETDFDHVAAAVGGALPIGALGTAPDVHVVRAYDAATSDLLGAWSFSRRGDADRWLNDTWAQRARNAQTQLHEHRR